MNGLTGKIIIFNLVKQVEEKRPLMGEIPAACERKTSNRACRNCYKTPNKYAERGRTRSLDGPHGRYFHAKWGII